MSPAKTNIQMIKVLLRHHAPAASNWRVVALVEAR